MNKWYKTLTCVGVIFLVSGCALVKEKYAYRPKQPGEIPATINYVYGENPKPYRNPLTGEDMDKYDFCVRVSDINGTHVWPWKSNKEIQNNLISLSPGPTRIQFEFIFGTSASSFDANLNVEPGMQYQLAYKDGKAWVADSTGKVLKEVSFTVGTAVNYYTPSPR
ncbi:MAG: hypothetical protein V4735_05550 [Pseudomonadota bacterium]